MNFFFGIQYSARALLRTPRFTATVILVLALAIGINTTFFSVFDQLMLAPFPYHAPNHLMMIWQANPAIGGISASRIPVTSLDYDAWRRENRSFEGIEAFQIQMSMNLTGVKSPELLTVARATPGFFQLLGVSAVAGRVFVSGDDLPGANRVVVGSYDFARKHFGDESATGKTLVLDDVPFTIVGILPKGFHLPALYEGIAEYKPEIWIPLPAPLASNSPEVPKRHRLIVCGRLKAGVSLFQARNDLGSIAERRAKESPDSNLGFGVSVFPLASENTDPDLRNELRVVLAAAALVLLLAWANLAGLMLIRAGSRRKDAAIMTALGASKWALVTPVLCESILLAFISGIAGWLLSFAGIHLIGALKPSDIHAPERLAIGTTSVVFSVCISFVTVLVVGFIPGWILLRETIYDALKSRSGKGSGRSMTRSFLIAGQIATALALTISAILLVQSFVNLLRVDPGFQAEKVLTAHISLPEKRYSTPTTRVAFCQKLHDMLRSLAGVRSAAFIDNMPLYAIHYSGFETEDNPIEQRNTAPTADTARVTPSFFPTMDVSLRQGRLFTDQDAEFTPAQAVIINEAFAHKFWPHQAALGKHIRELPFNGAPGPWQTVVGIVADFHQFNMETPARPELFWPAEGFTSMTVVLRTTAAPEIMGPPLRKAVWSIDHDEPVSDIQSLQNLIESLTSQRQFNMMVLSGFSLFSILLTIVGVFGVISSFISEHLRELGIRLALGAQRAQLCRSLVVRYLPELAFGTASGIVLSLLAKRIIANTLFLVNPLDLRTYVLVPCILLVIVLLTNMSATIRVTRLDPVMVLRDE
jgi:predicted permease